MNTDFVQAIKSHAETLNGQTVSVQLVGGQQLSGTLAYATVASQWGARYPEVLTLTVATKVQKIRVDHVSAIGQG
jgi:hypothetical protein